MIWTEYTDKAPEYGPGWAISDRGWLWEREGADGIRHGALGHYLDYGPEHYRSGDTIPTVSGGTYRWRPEGAECACSRRWVCRAHQPGNVLAVSVVRGTHRYCETVDAARVWIEAQAAG